MPNTNVLEGMRCPKCGSEEPFRINISMDAEVSDNGTDVNSHMDIEWEDGSRCECLACDHVGSVREFEIDPQPQTPERAPLTPDSRQLSAILAALRFAQTIKFEDMPSDIVNIATCLGTVDPLSSSEIDDLCETLNFAGASWGNSRALLESVYDELTAMGFGSDADINGADFVEYGGKLWADIGEALDRDGVPT